MKTIIFLLFCLLTGTANAQTENKGRVYESTEVDTRAEFTGGMEELINYMVRTVKYPAEAEKQKISGRVVVQFIVEKDGSITEAKITNSVYPAIDKDALRTIRLMPRWQPAKLKGKPVRSRESLPIMYRYK